MRRTFSITVSRSALAAAAFLCAPLSAQAASFTVPEGATSTAQQTVSGADVGAILAGGVLDVTKTAIVWAAPAAGPACRSSTREP